MMRSLYSGVSGLTTHQTKMDVIGNNIANVNTVGFKSTAVTFSDIMYQTKSQAAGPTEKVGGVNAKQIGLGALNAATKISIESGGASQTTGEAFDIKLTDSNATNFFIVNNGNQTLFTRAGSLYLDGSGNLAMTNTGYLIQGWQAVTDEDTGITTIRKDTVSPLRLMSPQNMTSEPEATTEAYVSGILDKNDSNVASNDGYNMSLGFYDDLGYLYTAKFAVNNYDEETETYTVKLTGIVDSNNNDILKTFLAQREATWNEAGSWKEALDEADQAKVTDDYSARTFSLSQIFGDFDGTERKTRSLSASFDYDGANIVTVIDGSTYVCKAIGTDPQLPEDIEFQDPKDSTKTENHYAYAFYRVNDQGVVQWDATSEPDRKYVKVVDMYSGASDDMLKVTDGTQTELNQTIRINDMTGKLEWDVNAINYELDFGDADGSFNYIGKSGQNAVNLNLSFLGPQFQNISVDFTKALSLNNNGSCTAGADRGNVDDPAVNAGKKIGAMTGMSVQPNGMIYGSYDNGNTRLLGQIAVAQFANPSGLESLGNNLYAQTLNSGQFDGIGVDITADGGKMETGMLEMSNVDLSREFTEMITTQRGFQANSRIITVSDTLLEELTNLKR